MTVLRLERVAPGLLDEVVARCAEATLVRRERDVRLAAAPAAAELIRLLARAGVRAAEVSDLGEEPRGLVVASGRSLAPIATALASDVIVLRRVPLGIACAKLHHRLPVPWARESGRARRTALLAGTECAYLWARRAHAAPSVLRDAAVRAVLMPRVFAADTATPEPQRLGYLTDGALERWAFA